ncbi:nitrogen fixation protein NifZ [Anaerobacillus sp. HL2]|nr:nitrogen fixation protein NifZ [Anaerobacillus sp. HL2]
MLRKGGWVTLYKYDLDERVVITKDLRNDGTFPDYERERLLLIKVQKV